MVDQVIHAVWILLIGNAIIFAGRLSARAFRRLRVRAEHFLKGDRDGV